MNDKRRKLAEALAGTPPSFRAAQDEGIVNPVEVGRAELFPIREMSDGKFEFSWPGTMRRAIDGAAVALGHQAPRYNQGRALPDQLYDGAMDTAGLASAGSMAWGAPKGALRSGMVQNAKPRDMEAWAREVSDEYYGDWSRAQQQLTKQFESALRQFESNGRGDSKFAKETREELARLKMAAPERPKARPLSDFTPEKQPQTLYHGSDNLFLQYDPKTAKQHEHVGAYQGPEDVMFASPSPAAAEHFGQNVYKLETNAALFDPEDGMHMRAVQPWIEAQNAPGRIMEQFRPGATGHGQMNSWMAIEETPGMVAELQRLGFDGARMSEHHPSVGNMPTAALWNRGGVRHAGSNDVFFANSPPAAAAAQAEREARQRRISELHRKGLLY